MLMQLSDPLFTLQTIDISTPESKPSKVLRKGKKQKSVGREENQEPEKQRQKNCERYKNLFFWK